jgi:uncharacterized membrane protein YoaK (UPF0700 family)
MPPATLMSQITAGEIDDSICAWIVLSQIRAEHTMTEPPSHRPVATLVLFGLAAVTGIVDAVCYLAMGHVFTANMTGNVVLLGFAVAGVESLSVSRSATAVVSFLVGAVIGVRLATWMNATGRRWPAAAIGLEAVLLFIAAALATNGGSGAPDASMAVYGVIVSTGLAMGMRNATVRTLGERDVNTTVLTMTLTGIAADSVFAGGTNAGLPRRVGFVLSVITGAAAGAWLLAYSAAFTLAFAGAASSLCAAATYLTGQSHSTSHTSTSSASTA